jgi:hypothetical protein
VHVISSYLQDVGIESIAVALGNNIEDLEFDLFCCLLFICYSIGSKAESNMLGKVQRIK